MKVFGVVVTYNSGIELKDNLKKNIKQFTKIIIVDNNSNSFTKNILYEVSDKYLEKVHIIYNKENVGLSIAQNIGIKMALSYQPEWIMILDDDSKLKDNSIISMIRDYNSIIDRDNIAMLVPSVVDINTNRESKYIVKNKNSIKRVSFSDDYIMRNVLTAIASGSLIKSEILKKYKMNEKLFIDYIDIDFTLNLNKEGYEIVALKNGLLFHSLGERSFFNVLGKKIQLNNHKPFRKYYIYRNRIYIWKKYINCYFSYVIYEVCVSIIESFKIILFEKKRKENFREILRGIKEGFKL